MELLQRVSSKRKKEQAEADNSDSNFDGLHQHTQEATLQQRRITNTRSRIPNKAGKGYNHQIAYTTYLLPPSDHVLRTPSNVFF